MTPKALLASVCIREFEGKVIYTGEKAIDAVGQAGAAALVVDISDMGPYAVLVSELPGGINEGMPAEIKGGRLYLGDVTIDMAGAMPWSSSGLKVRRFSAGRLLLMTKALRELSEVHYRALTSPKELDDLVYRRIGEALAEPLKAHEIVGLGYGMTPSGDDALVGFIAATGGNLVNLDALAAALSGTNRVGALMLECALKGEFPWRLANLISALNRNREDEIMSALLELSKAGHTSGLDMALGFLAGYRSMLRTSSP